MRYDILQNSNNEDPVCGFVVQPCINKTLGFILSTAQTNETTNQIKTNTPVTTQTPNSKKTQQNCDNGAEWP